MTKFLDGPAVGQILYLRRAPLFLRVAENNGKWDVLDQLPDVPHPCETLYAYRLVESQGHVHVRRDRKQGGSGIFTIATYAAVEVQPERETLRLNAKWQAWVMAQPKPEAPCPPTP